MSPAVAIVVPVYNNENYLEECLSSILNQSYQNFRVFMVDDGSTDGSANLLARYACLDSRFLLLQKENGGVSSARNKALEKIEEDGGFDLVCFVDSDDIIEKDFVFCYVKDFLDYDADFITIGILSFDRNGFSRTRKKSHAIWHLKADDCFDFSVGYGHYKDRSSPAFSLCIGNTCYAYELIRGFRFNVSLRIGEDQDFRMKAIARSRSCVIDPREKYYYRIRKGSLSRADFFKADDLKLYINWLKDEKCFSSRQRQAIEFLALNCWWQSIRRAALSGNLNLYWDFFNESLLNLEKMCESSEITKFHVRKHRLLFRFGSNFIFKYFNKTKRNNDFENLENAFP